MSALPGALQIASVKGPIRGSVRPPGSKSYTNRALVVAALADGRSLLHGVLESEDTLVLMESLRRLGLDVVHDRAGRSVDIEGCGGDFPARNAQLFLANSGTSIRFLCAACALGQGEYTLDGIERMRQRPIGDLLRALGSLGVDVRSLGGNDCPPVLVRARGIPGGMVAVKGDVSSQFLSALLMAAPRAKSQVVLEVSGPLVSRPYVEMTLAVMRAFGVEPARRDENRFEFPGKQRYRATSYTVEPDASAASYFFGAAAVTGGAVTVEGLGRSSLQGDLGFVHVLERMGCRVEQTEDQTTVVGGTLRGVDVDLGDLSDTVPTLGAVACRALGPTRIRNVAHVRVKETDRIAAVATELRRAGATVDEQPDGMIIHPPDQVRGADFQTYNDHRMAMSLALLGLVAPGVRILEPRCVEKTYPGYFSDLFRLTGQNRSNP